MRTRPVVLALLLSACGGFKYKADFCESNDQCPSGRCDSKTKRCAVPADGPTGNGGMGGAGGTGGTAAADAAPDAATDRLPPDTAADAPPPDLRPDLPPDITPDITPPDAPGTCGAAIDCRDPAKPLCVGNRCVQCDMDGQCMAADRPFCILNACAGCGMAPMTACMTRTPALPVCDSAAGRCVECLASSSSSSDCKDAAKPICDTAMKKCIPCTSDAQCVARNGADPGVCMSHQDGRCATDAETIYVENKAGCSMGGAGGGTAAMPFCQSQTGIDAVSGSKRVVVMRGPAALLGWSISTTGAQVTVVGQSGAAIAPGAAPGIRVTANDLYLRSLTIRGSEDTGVIAEPGSTLRMNRCLVESNKKGGILVNSAGFDITNTVIATNQGMGVLFGGVSLTAASGKPQKFNNNTIANNGNSGLVCTAAYPVKGLLLSMNTANDVVMCTLTSSKTSADGDPRFDMARAYRLTSMSPCVNAGDMTDFPPDDIDGDARPKGARSDCGADEF